MDSKVVEMNETVRRWAMATHLSAFLIFAALPFFNIIGPFLIWMVHKDKYDFVHRHGIESLNFQILVSLCCFPLVILFFIPFINWLILPLAFLILGAASVFVVKGANAAKNGQLFKYPIKIKIFS